MPEFLSGDLDRVSMASVLQLLEMEGHHGRLRVGEGFVQLGDGSVVDASFAGLTGSDAAIEALVRARGGFVVDDDAKEGAGPGVGVQFLVLESCRLLDDLDRFGTMVPAAGLQAEGPLGALLAAADGARTFAALAHACELPVVTVLPAFVDAVEQGVVKGGYAADRADLQLLEVRAAVDVAPAPEVAAAPAPPAAPEASFDDLLFDARKHARARRYDEALRALRAALAQRPDSRIAQQNLRRVQELADTR